VGTGDDRLAGALIVGAHQAQYQKHPTVGALQLLVSTVAEALAKYGLRPNEVDGLGIMSFQLTPDNVVTVAEQLGLEIRWAFQSAHGGAGGVVSLVEAASAITSGRAKVIVCAGADSFDVTTHMAMLDQFNTSMRDYLAPYGFGGTNGLFALVQHEHSQRYGTTRQQLGKLAVTQRSHAQHNPNALLRSTLSLNDYLNARIIAEPIRLFDCVMPCAGADVVVLTSEEHAAARGWRGVRLLAGDQRHNYLPHEAMSLTTGAASFADSLFNYAGVGREDLDFVQLYDDYPIMELIQMEDLGFAPKGEGGRFVETHDFSIHGDLPLNTGGGQLSCGQAGASGGMIGIFEAVTQLLGRADKRQVESARLGLVSGFGMVGYGKGLSSAAAILEAVD
jgi:acetyl-CoA acetyltransferase